MRFTSAAAVALLLGAGGLGLPGCGTPGCGPSNCSGCCNANNQCQVASALACGQNGVACQTCVSAQMCVQGACVFAGNGGNGANGNGGNGTATGTTASGTVAGSGSSGSRGATTSGASGTSGHSSTGGTSRGSSSGHAASTSSSSTHGATTGSTGCDCSPCLNSGQGCEPSSCTCIPPSSATTGGSGTAGGESSSGTAGATGSTGCDCSPCANAGLGCDPSTCACTLPSSGSAGSTGAGTTSTSAGSTGGSGSTGCDCSPCTHAGLGCDPQSCACLPGSTGGSGGSGSTGCDCTPCYSAGLGCDPSACVCEVPGSSSASSGASGGSTSASSSGGGSTSGSAGSGSGTSSGGSSGTSGGFCSVPPTPLSNDGIGDPCTPSDTSLPDGGRLIGHGDCANPTEYCFTLYLYDMPRCGNSCALGNPSCPGTSVCFDLAHDGSGYGYCLPLAHNPGTDCPVGLSCLLSSPNPADTCACVAACQSSTDCNAAWPDGGQTAFACMGGSCRCTDSATDCLDGSVCDLASGACIYPCNASVDCQADGGSLGCCVDYDSLGYCDPAGR